MRFPSAGPGTHLILDQGSDPSRLPVVRWVGRGDAAVPDARPGAPLLVEHSSDFFGRPGVRGHRLGSDGGGGRAWSTAFAPVAVRVDAALLTIEAVDAAAGLALRTEVEALPGGALRVRHVLTNRAASPYLLDGLEVSVPLADSAAELLDFTGRHRGERSPQRRRIGDGVWLRESRGGRPGLDSASMLVAGPPGFGFGSGEVLAVSVACSGNSALFAQRSAADVAVLGGGELLLPGELVLGEGESYASPWLFVVAADDGLDEVAGGAAHLAAVTARAPAGAAGHAEHMGGGLFRPRHRPAAGAGAARGAGRRRAVRPRRRLVPRPPRRHCRAG